MTRPRGTRRVVAVVSDLLLATRLAETARSVGVRLDVVPPDLALAACQAELPELVVLDLAAAGDPIGCARALKSDPATAGVRTVGFFPHVDQALRQAARAAGVDLVLPRSALATRLRPLLAGTEEPAC
jgi:DNA-binding NarL/FixJ family response regulator